MKFIVTSKFDPYGYKPLNDLVLKNRKEYAAFHNYDSYYEINPLDRKRHPSWRQAEIILKILKDPKFKKYDFIINSGQRNIVTNFNISFEEKLKLRVKDHHNLVYQSFFVNPEYIPFIYVSNGKGGRIKVRPVKEPALQLSTE